MIPQYLMQDKTKKTEIQAHIIKKPSIIAEHFPVQYCHNIVNRQTTNCFKLCSDSIGFRRKQSGFF